MENKSAFQEALDNIQAGRESGVPSYMVAADNLNIGNGNPTFLESAADVVEGIPKFIGLSLLSGVNQLQNIPANIGNAFGADLDITTTDDIIAGLDDDLGKFYEEHEEGIDLAGFIMSSIIPGTAGVKVLNAGQRGLTAAFGAGKFGGNMGKAMGLLNPQPKAKIAEAVRQVTTNSSLASLTNASALKAIGAGMGQNFLEAAAFEIAVAATMQSSPIMKDQDFGDLAANIAFSGAIFGAIGGVVTGAKVNSALKAAAIDVNKTSTRWTFIPETSQISSPYERIAVNVDELDSMPPVFPDTEITRTSFLENAKKTKTETLENKIKEDFKIIANGDQQTATELFQALRGTSRTNQLETMIGAIEIGRIDQASRGIKKIAKIRKNKAAGKDVSLLDEELLLTSTLQESYVKMHGAERGVVLSERPVVTQLSDTLKKGEVIQVTKNGAVKVGSETAAKFNLRANIAGKIAPKVPYKHWDIMKESANSLKVNARYIWANRLPKFNPTAAKPLTVHINDVPLMEKVLLDLGEDGLDHVRFTGFKEGELDIVNQGLESFLGNHKVALSVRLLNVKGEKAVFRGQPRKNPLKQDEIAAMVNMRSDALSGLLTRGPSAALQRKDILAYQSYAEELTETLVKTGSRKLDEGLVPILETPQHIKVTYDPSAVDGVLKGNKLSSAGPLVGINNHVIENMVIIKEQQRLYQGGTDNAAAIALGGKWFDQLEEITPGFGGKIEQGANQGGAGAGLATAASSNYGTLAASVEHIGNVTSRAIHEFKQKTTEVLEPMLFKMAGNRKAAIEWSALNQKVRSIEGEYALNELGDALEPAVIVRWRQRAIQAEEAGEEFLEEMPIPRNPNMEARIELGTKEVRDLAAAHIEINGVRTGKMAGIRMAQGTMYNRGPDVFYPVPVDPSDYKFFAMVTDESITSGNQSKTLFAATSEELDGMIKKIKQGDPRLRVRTKGEAERYFSSEGKWDYEKTLTSNYLDTAAHRKGVSAPFLIATDPEKIVKDTLKWHMDRETGLVREAVSAKYEVPFEELKRLGDDFTNVGTSKFGSVSSSDFADDIVKNPYVDYIKTALNIRKTNDYPWWVNTNKLADEAVSKMFKKINDVRIKAKSADELGEINSIMQEAGYTGASYDAGMNIFANSGPARGTLANTVQKSNSVMATVVLRMDTLNAVNNAVSANVLLGGETKSILRALKAGGPEAEKAIGALAYIKVPGTDRSIFSAQKLIANSMAKFGRVGRDSPEFKFYQDNGYMTRITDQYSDVLGDLAYNPALGTKTWSQNIDKAFKKAADIGDQAEILTGNRLAEEFNRFVAGDVMKQLTDVAVAQKLMTAKEQLAYINTFVNRTQGNYLAAQRPHMFQGPIGQSIGLFQTYQFNLMQQLLRHVGEGHSKDAMTLLGLQGSIHGMNGLPAFGAINTHLIGNASGNDAHRDAYDTVYGIAGKEAGDWLMYGAASNAAGLLHPDLKVNLYTRGDINPRHVTLVPISPASVPIVQATGKFMKNLFATSDKLAAGGDVTTTILQGLEHNGLSRPLAGLAQTLEGFNNPEGVSYSTSKKGNVIASNDLLSLANVGRMLGGKPLDEAIAIDAAYRFKAYAAKDTQARTALGAAIKTTMLAGESPTQEQVETFAQKYAEMGGRQKEFAGWFSRLNKDANSSHANELSRSLSSPFTQSMQKIMGGRELKDFTNTNE
jgi:hypothetical protein